MTLACAATAWNSAAHSGAAIASANAAASAFTMMKRLVGDSRRRRLHLRELLLVERLEVDRREVNRGKACARHRIGERLSNVREEHRRAVDRDHRLQLIGRHALDRE